MAPIYGLYAPPPAMFVEHQRVSVLHQAGRLLVGGLVKALLVELDTQASSRFLSALLEQAGIGLRCLFHLGQIGVQAHAISAGSLQILNGANKCSGTALYRLAQSAEVSACLRSQKEQRLLRFFGHGDEYTLLARLAAPCLHARKPLRGRRVGGPAQKRNDQHKVRRLALGKVGMNPQSVSRQQIRNLANGQRYIAPLDAHVHLGAGQIEGRGIGIQPG